MRTMFLIDSYFFLEKQVQEYMRSLLVKTPEQVVHYFEKQIAKYNLLLKRKCAYPDSVITSIQHLIQEYSSAIIKVKKYMTYQQNLQLLNRI
ncbi:hypothetical protein FZC66_09195 [Priestia megaterium]|nr:hypothetical protein FZC66_09195 [Priestia megaterium]